MKRILILLAGIMTIGSYAEAQQRPTVLSVRKTAAPYASYADQGAAMYQNNSQFYNKDNLFVSDVPRGNGDYSQPGNSNPINHDIYSNNDNTGGYIGTYDVYSDGILIRYNTYETENRPGGVLR